MTYEYQAAFLKQFYSEFVRRGPVANGVAWFIADSAKFSGNSFYPERGRTVHPRVAKENPARERQVG